VNRFHRRFARTSVALALVAIGCSKGDAPRADSTAKLAAAPAVSRTATPKVMPGALTKPIESYTGDELYDFVKRLQFSGGAERERKCRNDLGCSDAKAPKRTTVRVDAVATQDSISASTTPKFGVVYIRAINKGNVEEARYGMKPGSHLEYYMIVLPDSAGGMKWQLEQLDTTPKSRRHASIGSGAFQSCNHAWVAGARADFKTCAKAAAEHDSVAKLGLALQGVVDDPMWASCATGCCIGNT
jgi:hypothetical protein